MEVEYLEDSEMESMAQEVLISYEKKHGQIINNVPVDDILEFHLDMHLEVFDNELLPEQYEGQVLGYIDFKSNTVAIHESILPENNKGFAGRYNHTLAHEIGHSIMHKDYIVGYAGQMNCFEQEQPKILASTTNPIKPRIEFQADYFAAHFTMPAKLVRYYWYEKFKNYNPISYGEISSIFPAHVVQQYKPYVLTQMYFKKMAKKMGVSAEALTIRLLNMGLVTENRQGKLL